MSDLGTLPGGSWSQGNGINDSGQVTGIADTSSGYDHAFLYSGGSMTDLGTLPGGSESYGYGINASGQVTGESDTSGYAHAFLYSGGSMIDLDTLIDPGLGWTLYAGSGINDNGQITGTGGNALGEEHAFLLTPLAGPVPEPATLLLFSLGLAGIAIGQCRKLR